MVPLLFLSINHNEPTEQHIRIIVTDGVIITDASKFVQPNKEKLMSTKEAKESSEADYDQDKDQLKDKQEEEQENLKQQIKFF